MSKAKKEKKTKQNKYQKQVVKSGESSKKKSQKTKNPTAHAAWLEYKKTRNQAQYKLRKEKKEN
jgi:hypothetical protein